MEYYIRSIRKRNGRKKVKISHPEKNKEIIDGRKL
jgi:hypothetical protein